MKGRFTLHNFNGSLVILPIENITVSSSHARKRTDLSSLASSIKAAGVIQPIIVKPSKGEYLLISGQRRLYAAKLAGHKDIPAIMITCSNEQARALSIIENCQRKNLSIFEESEGIERLINENSFSKAEICQHLSITMSELQKKLAVLTLSVEERQLAEYNSLTQRHINAVLKLSSKSERIKLFEKIVNESLNVRQTEKLVLSIISPRKSQTKKGFVQGDIRLLVNTIDHAVAAMISSGIHASAERREVSDSVEYIIRVPKTPVYK